MKKPLEAKVALITGAARRIGAEIARYLHNEGMNIVLHYHQSDEEAAKLAQVLNQQRGNSAIAIHANLLEPESEKMLVEKCSKVWHRLDVLINNASRFYRTSIRKVTDYAWDDLMNSNLKAPFFLSQAAAPFLAEQRGSIINITDVHADYPLHDYSVYCASKGALNSLTKVLAKEFAPEVRVNAVAPGAVLWPEGENTLSEEQKQKIIGRTLLRRSGEPSDIAKAVVFLVRDADYMTGQVLSIDGGRSL